MDFVLLYLRLPKLISESSLRKYILVFKILFKIYLVEKILY